MKTVQKIRWINYLIIGLLIKICLLGISCNKTRDWAQDGEFYFVNETNHYISYQKGFERYNLAPKTTIIIKQVQDAPSKGVNPGTYSSPFTKEYAYNDPFIIKYDDNRCATITRDSEHSLTRINSYLAERISERKFKFTYTFTEADYNRAVACP